MKKLLPTCLAVALSLFFSMKLAAQTLDAVILGPNQLDQCFQPCGTYQASVVGGTAPYSYFWSVSGSTQTSTSSTFTWCAAAGSGTGNYTLVIALKVLDANGQTVSAAIDVFVSNNPTPLVGTVIPICDSCSGAILLQNISTPNCPVSYNWSNGLNTQNFTNICTPGTYSVTATNCQGCTSTGTFTVTQGGATGHLISDNPNPCNNPDMTGNPAICEKVCPGQSVTYSLQFTTPPGGTAAPNWQISGASSYQIAANKLSATVTWPTAGSGQITVFPNSATAPCGDTLQLCVAVTDAPVAVIGSNPKPNPAANIVVVCENQPVFFENKSLNSTYIEWDFGDFSPKNYLEKPTHAFAVAGTYYVRLVARSECFCADTTYLEIYVLPGTGPSLDCIGTVCKGTEVTYSTNANCGNFVWNVSPEGTVLSGGGPSDDQITIQWTGGETGQISLTGMSCSPAVCPIPAVFQIPIISNDAEIKGDLRICAQAESVYEIAPFGGANFVWTLASGGNITDGQGTNRVKVQWTAAPNAATTHWLSVVYENCYLGCGGQDSIAVKILPQYSATGPLQICDGATANFSATTVPGGAAIALDWTVFDAAAAPVFSVNNASSPVIPMNFGTGQFLVKTTPVNPNLTCSDSYEFSANVNPLPAALTAILGENQICPGQPYTYETTGLTAGNNIVWQFTNGSPAAQQGEKAVATWAAAGPYSISAKQKTGDALGCESPAISFSANKLPDPTISGDASVCAQTEGNYSATVFQNIDYQWIVSPADAGTVSGGQGTPTSKIFWYKAGSHSVSVSACGQSGSFPVTVHALPEPVAVAPDSVCAGGATIGASVTQVFAQYFWKNGNGAVVSNLAAPQIPGGHYELEVTDANGCRGDSTFFIAEKPLPNVNISTPQLEIVCPAANLNNLILYATNTDEGLDYQWFMDGSPIAGATVSTLTAAAVGNYHVVATAKNGCSASSNSIQIQGCGGGGGGGNIPNTGAPCPDVSFTNQPTPACNTRQYIPVLDPTYVPGTAQWIFGDGATSTVLSPTHTFPTAGFVKNVLIASFSNGSTCWNWNSDAIEVAADFAFGSPCAGGPIAFTDLSTFVNASITGWEWDFGDPASGTGNASSVKNPMHTFSGTGNFAVSLTVTSTSGCTSSITKNVGISAPPIVNIIDPTENCAGNALKWDAATPNNDIAEFHWSFGDPASGDANTATVVPAFHKFDNGGSYAIQLSVKSISGCRADFPKIFNIVANPLSGNIAITPASGKICEGKTALLTAPPGGTSWEWSDGSTSNSLIINEEGNFSVTLTDANGCTYSPADAVVEILPAPDASVSAIEKNELGLETGAFDSPYKTCFGDDVFLEASGNGANYTYSWPSGTTGLEEEFSADRGNLLPIGTQNFTLTITDVTTGCTNTAVPFAVVVNPVPVNVQIQISPTGMPCGNVSHVFSVQNPVGGLSYEWNTGKTGAFFQTDEPGNFFVIASNSFGCTAQSPAIFVQPGAPVESVTAGCLTRCTPDTICWSMPLSVTAWQWFLNGSPIPSPNGPQLIATQSGQYSIQLTDANGCTALSDPLTLDLQSAFGSVLGEVFSDVNDNGLIDAGDTLIGSMPVNLTDGATVVTSSLSNSSGHFSFVNVPSLPYSVALDLGNLPSGWGPVIGWDDATLSGCDDEAKPQLLVRFCLPTSDSMNLAACAGDSVFVQNQWVKAGATKNFMFKNQFGCDSLITVEVSSFAVPPLTKIKLPACAGSFVNFNGQQLAAGSTSNFKFQTTHGCDSLVQVTVTAGQPTSASISKTVCPGQLFDFQGIKLPVGDTIFNMTNAAGCDSTLAVSILAHPPLDFSLKTDASCSNISDGKLLVETINGSGPFDFSLDGGATWQDSASFLQIPAGPKTVRVRDGNDCFLEKTADVGAVAALSVLLENKMLDCDNLQITLEPEVAGADSTAIYQWKNSDGGLLGNALVLPVDIEDKYVFTAKNRCGTVEKTAEVTFDETSIGPLMYAPNAVSPTGLDANKTWQPFFSNQAQVIDYQLFVYDRWGNRVFETADPTAGWDGKSRGKRLRPGVFVWYLEASVNVCRQARTIREKGDITIVR